MIKMEIPEYMVRLYFRILTMHNYRATFYYLNLVFPPSCPCHQFVCHIASILNPLFFTTLIGLYLRLFFVSIQALRL